MNQDSGARSGTTSTWTLPGAAVKLVTGQAADRKVLSGISGVENADIAQHREAATSSYSNEHCHLDSRYTKLGTPCAVYKLLFGLTIGPRPGILDIQSGL